MQSQCRSSFISKLLTVSRVTTKLKSSKLVLKLLLCLCIVFVSLSLFISTSPWLGSQCAARRRRRRRCRRRRRSRFFALPFPDLSVPAVVASGGRRGRSWSGGAPLAPLADPTSAAFVAVAVLPDLADAAPVVAGVEYLGSGSKIH